MQSTKCVKGSWPFVVRDICVGVVTAEWLIFQRGHVVTVGAQHKCSVGVLY